MIRLKRRFDPDEVAAWRAAIAAGEHAQPPLPTHLDVQEQRGDRQNFSTRFVQSGIVEGWLSFADGEFRIRTADGDVAFRVLELPGVYCCHCGSKLDAGNEVAQAHVADHHADDASPDPQHPAGYRVSHAYACEVI
jgi:hypothetical protein